MSKQGNVKQFQSKCMQYMKGHGIELTSKKVLIALSGGADSVCLFHVLLALKEEHDIALIAVHVNHSLRETASRDEVFVKLLCEKYQVPLYVRQVDVKVYAKEKSLGIEEAARLLRYEQFEEIKQKEQADYIALAHHMDDQAETVLFHMSRGCSVDGLRGMLPVRDYFIRPLLGVGRNEIENYLQALGQDYVTDETNEDTAYTRNLIRKEILPMLSEQVCQNTSQHIGQMAEDMMLLEDYLQAQCEKAFAECVTVCCGDKKEENTDARRKNRIEISIAKLQLLHPYLQSYMLKKCLGLISQTEKDITRVHVNDMQRLLEKQTGRSIDLPYGVKVSRVYDALVIEKTRQMEESESDFEEALAMPEEKEPFERNVLLPDGRTLKISVFPRDYDRNIPIKTYTKWFDYAKIDRSLVVRKPKQGDYFMLDEKHKKKLKDYMKDQKIPADERKKKLVVAEDDHILYIIGGRISEAFKVSDETQTILEIVVE